MGQRLRTATPMGDWRSFKATCNVSGGYSQYDIVKVQETVGVVYFEDVEYGKEFVLIYHAEKILVDKNYATGESFLPGDKVYWSGTDGDPVTPNYTTGYYWIGIATEPADEFDTVVEIDLKGDKASLTEPL